MVRTGHGRELTARRHLRVSGSGFPPRYGRLTVTRWTVVTRFAGTGAGAAAGVCTARAVTITRARSRADTGTAPNRYGNEKPRVR